jgi:hypothetical protein
MGNIVALPKHSRATKEQADQLRQLALSLDMPDEARAHLDNALHKITETPGKRWLFVMINPDQFRFVTNAIADGPDAGKTLMIWNCALSYVRQDTGEIMANREQLAKDARTNPDEASRALSRLAKIGAIIRERRGRRVAYFINPNVGWNGGEGSRQEAAKDAPQLRLVR